VSKPTRHLDVTGALCPLPILLAAREMRKLRTGDLLEVVGDDPGIREDMPVWCERAGHRLLEMTDEEPGRVRSLVEKGVSRPLPPPPAAHS
jgi:tRNA 2-thiouridine synthesizing protein A